ncbi:MAG: Flp family type IVb pilin [Pseudomonadales bacterium]|nr:Flp family type IVb pilin [Pseudomonadales bacterium]
MYRSLFISAQQAFNNFKNDERGVVAIEYAVMGIALAAILLVVFSTEGSLYQALELAMDEIKAIIMAISTKPLP